MKTLSVGFLVICTAVFVNFTSCKSQDKSAKTVDIVRDFMETMIQDKYSDAETMRRYLKVDTTSKENVEFVKAQLAFLRDQLKTKSIKKEDLRYKEYNKVDFDDLMVSETNAANVFIVFNKSERLVPVLIDGKRINSFSTINKGGKRVFVNY